ncbi:MAG: hypothetical protein ACKPHU_13680, partial [Planctomycetaceae bacterium]
AFLLGGVPWGLRVRAELLSPASEGSEDIPIAAVFLIDNSISMKYRQENTTRLDYASRLTRHQTVSLELRSGFRRESVPVAGGSGDWRIPVE